MGQADTLIVPNKLESNFLAYSPFPEYVEAMSSIPKIAFSLILFRLMPYMKMESW